MAEVKSPSGRTIEVLISKTEAAGTYTYFGNADPGTATSAAGWSISRLTVATNDILVAAGGAFSQIWDNRASLSYA